MAINDSHTEQGDIYETSAVGACAGHDDACGCASSGEQTGRSDPLEGFNRSMYSFNYNVLDPYVVRGGSGMARLCSTACA
jgi:ABC-type transporter lipoprotein component MlaA